MSTVVDVRTDGQPDGTAITIAATNTLDARQKTRQSLCAVRDTDTTWIYTKAGLDTTVSSFICNHINKKSVFCKAAVGNCANENLDGPRHSVVVWLW